MAFGLNSTYENGVLDNNVDQKDIDQIEEEMKQIREGRADDAECQKQKSDFLEMVSFFPMKRPGRVMTQEDVESDPYYMNENTGYKFDIEVSFLFFLFLGILTEIWNKNNKPFFFK